MEIKRGKIHYHNIPIKKEKDIHLQSDILDVVFVNRFGSVSVRNH
jgi:hypothetical protein